MHFQAAIKQSARGHQSCPAQGVTLLELLVVIAIIGGLTAISLPALRGLSQSNTMTSATQQLMDDLALARQIAINSRCPVYVLFMGPADLVQEPPMGDSRVNQNQRIRVREQLLRRQYSGYILFSDRAVGDQPGQGTARYLSNWKTLPEGVFLADAKFRVASQINVNGMRYDVPQFPQKRAFPFPYGDSPDTMEFFYLMFDVDGRLVTSQYTPVVDEEVLPLARGSIMLEQTQAGLAWMATKPLERPPQNSINNANLIVIDAPTGRTRLVRPELQ